MRIVIFGLAALALAACGEKKADQAATPAKTAAPARDASADSAWIELTGSWAPKDGCGDETKEWRIEAGAFHFFETHCVVKSLALLPNGVRATAACSVEGDDDGADDVYSFLRADDATLTIVQEANGARFEGLSVCTEDMIP